MAHCPSNDSNDLLQFNTTNFFQRQPHTIGTSVFPSTTPPAIQDPASSVTHEGGYQEEFLSWCNTKGYSPPPPATAVQQPLDTSFAQLEDRRASASSGTVEAGPQLSSLVAMSASGGAHSSIVNTSAASSDACEEDQHRLHSNVFVCMLPPWIGDVDLTRMFSEFGAIESAKVMLNIHTGKSRGIAFVKYFQSDDAKRAIAALDGHSIGDHRIGVRIANPKAIYHPRQPTNKIFVRNIPSQITEENLRSLFNPFGEIVEISILSDTMHQQQHHQQGESKDDPPCVPPRRIAFITFTTPGSATRAAEATHATFPFAACGSVPILAKTAEASSTRRIAKQQPPQTAQAPFPPAQQIEVQQGPRLVHLHNSIHPHHVPQPLQQQQQQVVLQPQQQSDHMFWASSPSVVNQSGAMPPGMSLPQHQYCQAIQQPAAHSRLQHHATPWGQHGSPVVLLTSTPSSDAPSLPHGGIPVVLGRNQLQHVQYHVSHHPASMIQQPPPHAVISGHSSSSSSSHNNVHAAGMVLHAAHAPPHLQLQQAYHANSHPNPPYFPLSPPQAPSVHVGVYGSSAPPQQHYTVLYSAPQLHQHSSMAVGPNPNHQQSMYFLGQ